MKIIKSLSVIAALICSNAQAFESAPTVDGNMLTWESVDAIAINIHNGMGTYVASLPGDATSWTAPEPGSYYLVASNSGDWTTWIRSETVVVGKGSVDTKGLLISYVENICTWDEALPNDLSFGDPFYPAYVCEASCGGGQLLGITACEVTGGWDPSGQIQGVLKTITRTGSAGSCIHHEHFNEEFLLSQIRLRVEVSCLNL